MAATTTGRRAVNIATAKIQARYPLTTGTEVATRTLSVAVDALPFGPGIQSVNAGVGGTTVANYLTETTRTQLMSTAPDAIMHMILSNDFKFQTPLDTFKATLLGQINALDALAPGVPPIHVLFQPHERYDATFTPTIPFSEYGRVTAELAAANPDRMVFLDLSPAFRKLGIPGTDIYQLMNADLVHLGDEGHAFLGELVYDALFQQLSVSKAAAALPVPGFPTSTTTALVLNPTAPATGATTTLTATVTPTAAGSVEFFDGATSRGSAAVAGGVASIVTPALAAGAHSFTATFTPADATAYSSSTSPAAAITVATPGQTYSRYTSDGFSAVDGTQLVGSTSDAANGGTEQTWVGTGSLPYLSTLGGKAVRGSQIAAAFLGFKTTASAGNQRVSIKLDTLPAVDLQLVARRNQVASGAGLSQYQAIITPAGTATLNKTVSNMASTIGTAHAVAAGDVVGLYCYETTVALQINGVTVETVTDTTVTYVSSGANAGVRVGSTGAVSIDDFALDLVS
jgi:lysophospholipase L1-like esterase